MPKVYNKNKDLIPDGAVYVGRPSPFGNPFVIGKDGDRQDTFEQLKALGLPVITGTQMAEELGVLLTDDLEEVNRSVNNSFYLGVYLRNLGITKPCVFKTNTLVIESMQ